MDRCNLSGTGAGKTLSAILASHVIGSKTTLVVCPNDVVEQWATAERISITAIFPDSKVITGKPAFDAKYEEDAIP
jgi:superfamily II DNA or RNA helicase